jgi:hypothetical protein
VTDLAGGAAPLGGDGTPLPLDPALWTPVERDHLERFWFDGELVTAVEVEHVGVLDEAGGPPA